MAKNGDFTRARANRIIGRAGRTTLTLRWFVAIRIELTGVKSANEVLARREEDKHYSVSAAF
jgi:hypothetical protein